MLFPVISSRGSRHLEIKSRRDVRFLLAAAAIVTAIFMAAFLLGASTSATAASSHLAATAAVPDPASVGGGAPRKPPHHCKPKCTRSAATAKPGEVVVYSNRDVSDSVVSDVFARASNSTRSTFSWGGWQCWRGLRYGTSTRLKWACAKQLRSGISVLTGRTVDMRKSSVLWWR